MQETVPLGAEQLAAFEAAYFENNRPVQPLNGRAVEIGAEDGQTVRTTLPTFCHESTYFVASTT